MSLRLSVSLNNGSSVGVVLDLRPSRQRTPTQSDPTTTHGTSGEDLTYEHRLVEVYLSIRFRILLLMGFLFQMDYD